MTLVFYTFSELPPRFVAGSRGSVLHFTANCLTYVNSLKIKPVSRSVPLFSGWKESKKNVLFIYKYVCINMW